MSGKNLRNLFVSYASGDDIAAHTAAQAIIAEERRKNNRLLADDLEQILHSRKSPKTRHRQMVTADLPKDRETGIPLVDVSTYDYDWVRLVLAPQTLDKLVRIADENHRRDLLATAGLKPTQRVLFYGPPGCGKSITAAVLASVLSRPLVTIRIDSLISSYLGETSSNLRRVFDFIQSAPFVVLFDEFDALGKDRDNHFEHGELKRLVNSLLQLLDGYRGDSVAIAATNHPGLLDHAVWRRFESIVKFAPPRQAARIHLLRLYLRAFDTTKVCLPETATVMRGLTGADIELVAIDAARKAVLDGRAHIMMDDMAEALRDVKDRVALAESPTARSRRIKTPVDVDEDREGD